MIELQKLQINLSKSQKWGQTFKEEIKECLQELTNKNQQIAKVSRDNLILRKQIQNTATEHKSLNDQSMKISYKSQKFKIQIEQFQSRLKVYDERYRKKYQWNQELKNKIIMLELEIEREKTTLGEDQFYNAAQQLNISENASFGSSISSSASTFKQKSLKKVFNLSRILIEQKMTRLSKLQKEYNQLNQKSKALQSLVEEAKRKGDKLKQKLKSNTDSQVNDNKQNVCDQYNQIQAMTEEKLIKKICQLQKQRQSLVQEIIIEQKWIKNYQTSICSLTECDSTGQNIRKQIIGIERQAKRQMNLMISMDNYLGNNIKT